MGVVSLFFYDYCRHLNLFNYLILFPEVLSDSDCDFDYLSPTLIFLLTLTPLFFFSSSTIRYRNHYYVFTRFCT